MAGLDVWIAKQGSACEVDDQAWNVTVFNAHNQVFQWGGVSYANLAAPLAHWSGSIPPGTYVVRATSADKSRTTDHAIVAVDCQEVGCVRLYVASKEKEPEHPGPRRCRIDIVEVVGIGQPAPSSIRVSGTAANCKKIKVSLACGSQETGKAVASVQASGKWTANINAEGLKCKCGGRVAVIARCAEDPECVTKFEADKLNCKRASTDDVPK